jgi:hypothetical protein
MRAWRAGFAPLRGRFFDGYPATLKIPTVLGRDPHKRGLHSGDFISYGMSGQSESEATMAQQMRAEQMPTRSRAWLEAECLTIARRTAGGKGVERVMIRRLNPKGIGPNWKVADIIPQPAPSVSGELRQALAPLTATYTLEDEPR